MTKPATRPARATPPEAGREPSKVLIAIPPALLHRLVSRWDDYDRLTPAGQRTGDYRAMTAIVAHFRKLLSASQGTDPLERVEVEGSLAGWQTIERFCFAELIKCVNQARENGALSELGAL